MARDMAEDGAATSAMWVLPRDTVGKGTLWTVLKENAFFELLQHRVSAAFVFQALSFFEPFSPSRKHPICGARF